MSYQPSDDFVSPQESYDIGYDKGWADAREYWTPIEQDRIVELLEQEYEQGGSEMGIIPHLISVIRTEL